MCFSLQREGGAYVRSPLQSLEFLLVYSAICQYVAFLATVFFFLLCESRIYRLNFFATLGDQLSVQETLGC